MRMAARPRPRIGRHPRQDRRADTVAAPVPEVRHTLSFDVRTDGSGRLDARQTRLAGADGHGTSRVTPARVTKKDFRPGGQLPYPSSFGGIPGRWEDEGASRNQPSGFGVKR